MIFRIIDLLVLRLESSRGPHTHLIVKESTSRVKPASRSKALPFYRGISANN
jgi:hypothetical protein